MDKIERRQIRLPLSKEIIQELNAGDGLLLTGYLYTARDAAHKKLVEMIGRGEKLPVDLAGETIYYSGPCPSKPGDIIGSAGPTTSGRMDAYAPALMREGLIGMIGKGNRSRQVVDAIIESGAVYLGATGGAGALIAQCIRSAEVVAFPELGTEAIRRIWVEEFPVIVLIDSMGNNLYEIGKQKYCK
ncbi:MAG: Fe-S-containing hydro-lyase [Saccharofermentanales bacterium]